jgi:lipoprotein-releasing system permease protein
LKITGIADLGKYEYDSRFVLIGADRAMELRGGGKGFTGLRLRLKNADLAEQVKLRLEAELGNPYWAKSWFDVSRNLFEAIKIEKKVILVVVLLMVVTACFNICSTLFVNVLKRYTEISIFQTMGASPRFMRRHFAFHGLVIGFFGCVLGLILGVGLSLYLPHTALFNIPGEVYKLDHLRAELRFSDLAVIFCASMLICFVSTFAPARKGSRLKPVEGLRYE